MFVGKPRINYISLKKKKKKEKPGWHCAQLFLREFFLFFTLHETEVPLKKFWLGLQFFHLNFVNNNLVPISYTFYW